jgi:hypothetical protein
MGTNPVTPKQTASNVLNALAEANGYVNLALQLGTALIPVGKALVTKVKDATTGVETISYQLLLAEDQATLSAIDASSTADLQAINAELVRQGAQPLPIPGPTGPQ